MHRVFCVHYSFYFKPNSSSNNSSNAWPPPPSPLINQHEGHSPRTNQNQGRGLTTNQNEVGGSVANQYEARNRSVSSHEMRSPVSQDQYSNPRTGHYAHPGQPGHPGHSPVVPPHSPQSNIGQYSPQYGRTGQVSTSRVEHHQTAAVNQTPNSYGNSYTRQTSASSNYSLSPGYHEGTRVSPGQTSTSPSPGRPYGHVSSPQGHGAYSHLSSACDTSVQNSQGQGYPQNSPQPMTSSSPGYHGNPASTPGHTEGQRLDYQGQSHNSQLQHQYNNSHYSSHGYQQPGHHGNSALDYRDNQQGQRSPHSSMQPDSYSEYR